MGLRKVHDAVRRASWGGLSSLLVLAACGSGASAPTQVQATAPETAAARPAPEFRTLVGRWVRPDGGYVVAIESVSEDGKLEASYANPNPLPFSRAEATRDGSELRVFLELTAGGYGGSTYTLIFDPVNDLLRGVYFQAVAQQRFDVYFERAQ